MIFSSDPKAQSWVGRLRKMLWLGIRWVAQQVAWLAWWDSGSGRCKHWVWGSGWWNVESQAGGNADGSVGEAVETHSGVLVVEVEAQEIVKKRIHSWVQAGCGGARGWVVGRPGSWKLVASWSPERSRSDKVNRVTNSSTRDEFHWGEHKWGGRVPHLRDEIIWQQVESVFFLINKLSERHIRFWQSKSRSSLQRAL